MTYRSINQSINQSVIKYLLTKMTSGLQHMFKI